MRYSLFLLFFKLSLLPMKYTPLLRAAAVVFKETPYCMRLKDLRAQQIFALGMLEDLGKDLTRFTSEELNRIQLELQFMQVNLAQQKTLKHLQRDAHILRLSVLTSLLRVLDNPPHNLKTEILQEVKTLRSNHKDYWVKKGHDIFEILHGELYDSAWIHYGRRVTTGN